MTALSLLVALAVATPLRADEDWRVQFPVDGIAGEAMVVSGTVYASDGKTPVAGARVYAYHTDTRGYYSEDRRGATDPRIRGTMVTREDGRYEFRSIRPGPYPSGGVPAHVHYEVTAPDGAEDEFELIFQGDPLVSDRMRSRAGRGDFFILRPIERDEEGVWRVTADLILSAPVEPSG